MQYFIEMKKEAYRELRLLIGTQQKVADLLGVNISTLQRREAGQIEITREAKLALQKLAGAK